MRIDSRDKPNLLMHVSGRQRHHKPFQWLKGKNMNCALTSLLLLALSLSVCIASNTANAQGAAGVPQPASAAASAPEPKSDSTAKDGAKKGDTAGSSEQQKDKPVPGAQFASAADNGAPNHDIWVKGRSTEKDVQHEVSLGDYVILKLNDKFSTYSKTDRVGHKIGLYINDLYFKDLTAAPVVGRENAVMFHLLRTDNNRDSWSVLFAKKTFSLKRNVSCGEDPNDVIRMTVGYDDGTQVGPNVDACLEYFPNGWAAGSLLVGAVVLICITLFLAFSTSMLRDPGIPLPGKMTTWSLARFQMALWFVTVVCGVLFTYAVTGDIAPIPDGVLILMGIGAGTAVSAFAIDAVNIPGSKADYETVKDQQAGLDKAAADAQTTVIKARIAVPVDPKLADLEKAAVEAKKAAADNTAKRKSFETSGTRNFFFDILSDGNGIAFHRLQVFAWTMTYWFMFIAAIWHKITLIDFGVTQLALMGISGATYLGFKLTETPKQPGGGQGSNLP